MRKLDPEAVISTVVFGEDSMSRSWMLMVWASCGKMAKSNWIRP